MIPPAADAFLRNHPRTFLLTVRPDGAPACHPMVGLWRDGALWMNTYRTSAKARNVARDARAACVVVTDDDAAEVRGVVLRGRVEVVADGGRPGGSGLRRPEHVGEDVARRVQARLAEGKRVLLRLVPDDVRLLGSHA